MQQKLDISASQSSFTKYGVRHLQICFDAKMPIIGKYNSHKNT